MTLAVAGGVARERFEREVSHSFPVAPEIDLSFRVACLATVAVTVDGAERIPWHTTIRALLTSPAMWRRMHLADWNRVAPPLRDDSLDAMLTRYALEVSLPGRWDVMSVGDWDDTPQPIRTVAFRRMTAYWAGYYAIARSHHLPPALVAETLAAIVMSESWFDHRATGRSAGGTVDLGLGQASPFARMRLRQLHRLGVVDIDFSDDDYLDPWKASRFAAVWLTLMLDESRGDLELAVRAYHRGMADARDARGDEYYATVQQRLRRYIRNGDAPPAWDYLWRRARQRSESPYIGPSPPLEGCEALTGP